MATLSGQAVAAGVTSSAVETTGQYVYTVSPPHNIVGVLTSEAALRNAAVRFWGNDSLVSAVLTKNGIADGGDQERVVMNAALDGPALVVTLHRTGNEMSAEAGPDGRVVTRINEWTSEQKLTYDTTSRTMRAGAETRTSRGHKSWAEGEPVPGAFTADPLEP